MGGIKLFLGDWNWGDLIGLGGCGLARTSLPLASSVQVLVVPMEYTTFHLLTLTI